MSATTLTSKRKVSSTWFMCGLALLQAGAAFFVWREGNAPLAAVYLAYGFSNLMMIWVHRAAG